MSCETEKLEYYDGGSLSLISVVLDLWEMRFVYTHACYLYEDKAEPPDVGSFLDFMRDSISMCVEKRARSAIIYLESGNTSLIRRAIESYELRTSEQAEDAEKTLIVKLKRKVQKLP